ncbi:MAG: polysaccharide deacetylase family protein [Lachnospiraceae bacterium]|nr:polysaccharide deacetylase family protein [Lachnospiraceae bacterium]
MEEKQYQIAWYRLRGLGLVCLCSLVFFIGAYVTNQKSIIASSTVNGQRIPVSCVQTEEKKAALTFDTVWGNDQTRVILNILEQYGAKATFFVTGEWVDRYPEDVKAITAAGHEVGNYSQSYRDMSGMSKAEIQTEIQTVHDKVWKLTGTEMKLFRAPYGDYDNELIDTVKQSGYLPVMWDVDSEDWKDYGIEAIIQKVTENPHLGKGSIILLHSDAKYMPQALEAVIAKLQEQGYELVPASELVRWSNYSMDGEGRQIPEQNKL